MHVTGCRQTKLGRTARLVAVIAVVVAASGLLAGAARAAPLANGDFETGDFTGWTTFVTPNGGIGSPHGATGPAGVALFDTTGSGASYAAHFSVGEIAGQIGGGPPEGGGIYQSVTVSAEATYVLSADIATFGGFNADCGTYALMVDGGVVASHDFGFCGAVGTYRSTLSATAALGAGSHEIRILITRRFGPDFTMTQYVDNVTLAPLDSTAPTITVPAPITVNATSPVWSERHVHGDGNGRHRSQPTPDLQPLSGSLFPIGETTVSCAATDAAGNTGTASFKVTVEGAAEQLADLRHAVQDVGPGRSLVDKVEAAQGAYAAGDEARSCEILHAFINEVKAQAGKKISASTATPLIADATRISAVIGC